MLHLSVLAFSALFLPSVLAQSSSTPVSSGASITSASITAASSSPSETAATPSTTSTSEPLYSIVPGDGAFTYAGCWNETTGIPGSNNVRALAGGTMESELTMTPEVCIAFCSSNSSLPYNYAGLEYGRECWCATYLSALSVKLPDSACNLPCAAQPGSACGGSLTITLYNKTIKANDKKGTAAANGAQWWTVVGATVGLVAILGL